jgi:alcohol dehydrogenase
MMFAREAMRLCIEGLERVYTNRNDHRARVGMAYASVYAALSYGSAGLNAVHGIAYAVAGQTHKSHGSTNAVMLLYVLDALRDVRRTELLEIARMFGLPTADEAAAVRAVPQAVRDMIRRLGIPTNLEAFGLQEAASDAMAITRLAKGFPVRDVASSYRSIVRNAFEGALSARVGVT